MNTYIISFKFDGVDDEAVTSFAQTAAQLIQQLQEQSYEGSVENIQIAVTKLEEEVEEGE